MSDSFRSYGLWPPGSSLHRILQARILEGVADPPPGVFPTQLSNPSLLHCRRILYCWATRAAPRLTLVTCSCCCSAAQSCWTLCNPMDCSTSGFPVLHCLPEFAQTHVHWVSDAISPSQPLLPASLPASIFPSIRVFSNESALHISLPKYWSFSFSISPSNEYPGMISFRID